MPPIHGLAAQISNAYKQRSLQTPLPFSKTNRSVCQALYEAGFIQGWAIGDYLGPWSSAVPLTPENAHSRKLWVTLKYRQGEPALSEMKAVSKPSRRVFASVGELQALAAAKKTHPLLRRSVLGQLTLIDSVYGILELRDAVSKRIGGEVLATVV